MRTRIIRWCVLAALCCALAPAWAQYQERILRYHSDITVKRNASMRVREMIRVRATGMQIRHGIYRDFPTQYRDRMGNHAKVGFQVLMVSRDGRREPYHLENLSNGVRIYIGDKDRLVSPGEHTYAITYATDRQLGFFNNHDELFWNVTGDDWVYPIDQASATVTLPGEISPKQMHVEGYTGSQGTKRQDYRAWVDASGKAQFITTRPLGAHEGFTIVVTFPKGHVNEPTSLTRIGYFISDNRIVISGLIGFLLVLSYFIIAWARVGRDLPAGAIIPLYTPPKDYSPAALRFVRRMGYDHKAFATALINLAVKGYVTITEEKEGLLGRSRIYTVTRTGKPARGAQPDLAPEEKGLLQQLLPGPSDSIELTDTNYRTVQSAIFSVQKALKRQFVNLFFVTNTSHYLLGLLLSIVVLFVSGFSLLSGDATATSSGIYFFLAALIVVANVVFYVLLKAPTVAGRKLMDEIEGFRMYLETAEKEELHDRNPPERTPELFERYLPYALALDVEQQWSEQFADVLARAAAEGHDYQPSWYRGVSWHTLGAAGFASGMSHSFSKAISSSATAPGSRSGSGGGGSSGGGGGGGGGGGW